MRPIPIKMRMEIAADPFMGACIYDENIEGNESAPNHDCDGRIEWEHAWNYAGKQINEPWAICACCTNHNRGNAMDKDYNRYRTLKRGIEMVGLPVITAKYPKKNWQQEWNYLKNKFENIC